MAAHTMDGSPYYTLEGTVLTSSIEVYVDDYRMSSGWTFDEGFNSVIFDEGDEPNPGSEVRIEYLLGGECE